MNRTEILSFNPGSATLGELHPEAYMRSFRRNVLSRYNRSERMRLRRHLYMVFGLKPAMGTRINMALLIMRVVVGVLMITAGVVIPGIGIGLQVLGIVAGSVILTGTFTRILSGIATVCFCGFGISAALSGGMDLAAFSGAFLSLIIAVSGPGYVSVDTFIYGKIISITRILRNRRTANMLSHKAYFDM